MEKKVEEAPKPAPKKESLAERVLNSKVMIWATIIGTILGIVGYVQAELADRKKSEFSVSMNYHNRELPVGKSDTLIPTVKPEEGIYEYIWKSDNETVAMVSATGVVRLLEEGSATITLIVKDKAGEMVQSSCLYIVRPEGFVPKKTEKAAKPEKTEGKAAPKQNVASQPTAPVTVQKESEAKKTSAAAGVLHLGYGSYDGDTRNGQPHGNGVLTFNTSHLIPGTVDCTARAGEKVVGTFREGKVNLGTWYRNDGTQMMVKLGQKYSN